jgi:hypothetical protein
MLVACLCLLFVAKKKLLLSFSSDFVILFLFSVTVVLMSSG